MAPTLERQLTLQQLRVFKSVVEHRNFTRAAEALFLTQPAVTHQVQGLARTMGQPLFVGRDPGQLTPVGQRVYEKACSIVADLRDLDGAVADAEENVAGAVRVAGDITFGTYILPRAVAGFHSDSPGVRVHMAVTRGNSIRDRLLRRDADVGIVSHDWDDERICSTPLLDNEVRCFAAPDHPLACRSAVRLEDLARRVLLVSEVASGSSRTVQALFQGRNVNLDPAMEIADNEARKRAAIEGLGVAILSTYAVRAEVGAGLLVALPAEGFPIQRTWHSVWLRNLRLPPSAEAFLQYLCSGAWRPDTGSAPGLAY